MELKTPFELFGLEVGTDEWYSTSNIEKIDLDGHTFVTRNSVLNSLTKNEAK